MPNSVTMIRRSLRTVRDRLRLWLAERAVDRFQLKEAAPHGLEGQLVVSLTSYPPRYGTLHKTLKSLLLQTIKADRTVLWIAEGDMTSLPEEVRRLVWSGLEIRPCTDLRSYNKIIPALNLWPEAYIVTADDDLYYPPDWLETLVRGVVPGEKVIVCRRAHLPRRTATGFAPYSEWHWDIVTDGGIRTDLFPTGVGGVIYPPRSLPPETLDEVRIRSLCPTADDIWLFWMGSTSGARYRQVGGGFSQITWAGSQTATLASVNCESGNDDQLRALMSTPGLADGVSNDRAA